MESLAQVPAEPSLPSLSADVASEVTGAKAPASADSSLQDISTTTLDEGVGEASDQADRSEPPPAAVAPAPPPTPTAPAVPATATTPTTATAKDISNDKQWAATVGGPIAIMAVIVCVGYFVWGQPTYIVAPAIIGLVVVFALLVAWLALQASQQNRGVSAATQAANTPPGTPPGQRVQQEATASAGVNLVKLAALVVVIVALGAGAYYLYTRSETPPTAVRVVEPATPLSTPTVDDYPRRITIGKEWSKQYYIPAKHHVEWDREEPVGFEVEPDGGSPVEYPRDEEYGEQIPEVKFVRFRILNDDPATSLNIRLTYTQAEQAANE